MNQAKKRTLSALVAGGFVLASSLLLPAPADAQVTGIRNTKHYLGSGAPAGNNRFSGTDEICVFCHTPHGAATGAGNPPLWNKNLPQGPYTLYSSTTMDAGRATDGITGSASIGSVSIACLSCHDGSLAINAVINAPGSGLTNAAYTAGTWTAGTGTNTPVDTTTGKFTDGIAKLGTDLSNDHPIGIQYCGGGWLASSATGTCADSDFNAPSTAEIGGQRVFWVDTDGTTATRSKNDLTLYNRTFAAGVGPSVECASCHDPHTDAQATFLRRSNSQSGLCLSCHKK